MYYPISNDVIEIDEDDLIFISILNWTSYKNRNTKYAQNTNHVKEFGRIPMHRMIMKPSKNNQIDHIDHNGLNNKKDNLREVSNRQNSQNRINQKYPGTYYHKASGLWHSRITINYKVKSLGYYKTQQEAYEAYLMEL